MHTLSAVHQMNMLLDFYFTVFSSHNNTTITDLCADVATWYTEYWSLVDAVK